jgi:hypothetical protein
MPGFIGVRFSNMVPLPPAASPPPATSNVYVGCNDRTIAVWDGTAWTTMIVDLFDPSGGIGDPAQVRGVAAASDGTIYAKSQGGDKVAKSTDGGATWTLVTGYRVVGFGIQNIHVDSLDRLYVVNLTQVDRSSDGGATWAPFADMTPLNGELQSLDFTPVGRVWYPMGDGNDQICQRFDADGSNRMSVTVDFDNFDAGYVSAAPDSETRAWVFNSWYGGLKLWLVASTAASRVDPTSGPWLCHGIVDFGGGTAIGVFLHYPYSSGDNGVLYRTTDYGSTWTSVGSDPAYAVNNFAIPPVLLRDPATLTTAYLIASGGLYISTDSGTTWTVSSVAIPVGGGCALAVAANG